MASFETIAKMNTLTSSEMRPIKTAGHPLRVLVSAYACEPGMGSEPGIGWNTVRELGQRHEVWVITRANNQAKIESALASSPMPSVHFVYFDLPKWSRFWKRGSRAVNLYYYLWQLGAYFTARKLMRS